MIKGIVVTHPEIQQILDEAEFTRPDLTLPFIFSAYYQNPYVQAEDILEAICASGVYNTYTFFDQRWEHDVYDTITAILEEIRLPTNRTITQASVAVDSVRVLDDNTLYLSLTPPEYEVNP